MFVTSMAPANSASPGTGAHFPTTHWSMVLSAGGGASAAALEALCSMYWPPLYAFLRRDGKSPADAQDLVQSFVAKLLAREDLGGVHPEKGKFRTFLLVALRHHVISEGERAKAAKRGGGRAFVPLDLESAEVLCAPDLAAESPERAFARSWARTVLDRAFRVLREEQQARGRATLFEALAPCFEDASDDDYRRVGEATGMQWQTVRVTAFRLRRRLAELVKAEVRQTVGPEGDVEAEYRELLASLAGP